MKHDFEKSVSLSIHAIQDLQNEIAYITRLPNYPIDNSIATSVYEQGGGFICKFFLNRIHDFSIDQQPEILGIGKDITLDKNGKEYLIKGDSLKETNIIFGEPQVITIKIGKLQTGNNEKFDNKNLRLIIPTKKEIDLSVFEFKSLKIRDSITVAGLIEISIDDQKYHLFKYKNEDEVKNYLAIESVGVDQIINFKTNCKSIILGFGLITGNLFQDEYYFQAIDNDEHTSVENTIYEQQEKSIISDAPIFDPFRFKEYIDHIGKVSILRDISLWLKPEIFSKLCTTIKSNNTIARCIQLILEGNQTRLLLLRASIYSIAIETMTNIVYEENEDKENPIPDSKLAKLIREKIKACIEEYSEFISDYGKSILYAKIQDINKPTNSKKLSKAFELLGIRLSKSDLDILNHRNKFLHGTSPFEEIQLQEKTKEISYISKKLHFMITCLILKYIGYRGHIVNFAAWQQLHLKEQVTDHPYNII